ncbi:hypothetical protein PPM_0218 [Paenibacillus polymyxa M1]|nr:hypothetical protein PPM_0218 [Paenibacillus polymyxa M1]
MKLINLTEIFRSKKLYIDKKIIVYDNNHQYKEKLKLKMTYIQKNKNEFYRYNVSHLLKKVK